jgi:glycerophosphoryl diester phosphodiesterase
VFSSFDPDAATLMRALQGTYPVMILTDGEENHDDPRRRSVEAAMKVALKGGLCGVVADVARLVENPKSAELVKDSGLLLASYGSRTTNR